MGGQRNKYKKATYIKLLSKVSAVASVVAITLAAILNVAKRKK